MTGVAMGPERTIYWGGTWGPSHSGIRYAIVDPATDAPVAEIPCCDASDIASAVSAARSAFERWVDSPLVIRKQLLQRIRAGIVARADDLAAAITAEMGSPISFSRQAHIPVALRDIDAIIDALDVLHDVQWGSSRLIRQGIGVVAGLTPWNFPLHQMISKLAPALAAGCAIVLKPSENASLSAAILADIMHEAATPPGLFNMILGDGPTGEALVRHPDIDLISFTGSSENGRRVAIIAAENLKKSIMELGGKSANILLPDADPSVAVKGALAQCFANSGQFCASLSRLLVPQTALPRVEELALAAMAAWSLGDPKDPATALGPLSSRAHQARVRRHIEHALEDGARLLCGGAAQPAELPQGAYVSPTIFSGVTPAMRLWRDEVFGPVLAITPYRDIDEAVVLANDSQYGLSSGIWSANLPPALDVARRLRCGQVVINGARLDVAAPFGGIKKSGWGREYGRFGIEEYSAVKTVLGSK